MLINQIRYKYTLQLPSLGRTHSLQRLLCPQYLSKKHLRFNVSQRLYVTRVNKSSNNSNDKTGKPRRPIFYYTAALLTLGCTTLYLTDNDFQRSLNHIYLSAKRSSIVGIATMRCFYHYKRLLSNPDYTDEDLSRCHKRCALITLHALERNGGIFIKLGQHIGAMSYLLPREWTDTMVPLQDQCPESSYEDIDSMFQEDLGVSIDEMFSEFANEPIGTASLAQVHVARLKGSGEKVAVKCQHPALKEFIPIDVLLTQTVFELMDAVFPEYPLTWLGDELQCSIYVELDFTKEAENAQRTSDFFAKYRGVTALRVPQVRDAYQRILIMEYVDGRRLDDLEYMDDNGISRSEVSSCLSHIFNSMIFTPGVGIHCDPHGGNLAIRKLNHSERTRSDRHNFEIILYDHGLYRYPETSRRVSYAKFWLALLDKDMDGMRKYAKEFANVTDDQFPLFAAAITGRSIETALNYDITKPRTQEEIDTMHRMFMENNLLTDLMSILSRIPRIVILILKTNDLTRFLDESLHNPLGPVRTFLIMTQYCARLVYRDALRVNDEQHRRWSFEWVVDYFKSWLLYQRRYNQLVFYDFVLWCRQGLARAFSVLSLRE